MVGILKRCALQPAAFALFAVCVGGLAAAPEETSPAKTGAEIIEMSYTLKAPAPETAMRTLRRLAEERGGHLVGMEATVCTVDLPATIGAEAAQELVRGLGAVVDRNVNRTAVGSQMADLEARIRARRNHLGRLEKLFTDVDLNQTLALESETAQALRELDRLRGELNYYRERSRMLRVSIRLELSASARGSGRPPIPAPWVGTLTLQDFLRRFGP